MGCSCNKKKRRPPTPPAQPAQPAPQPQQTTGATGSFELRTTSGQTLTFGSRLEAEAARARRGGAGQIKPV